MRNCSKIVLHKFQNSLSEMKDKGVCVCMDPAVMLLQACDASVKLKSYTC